jgi:hypothetical protein
MGDVKKNQVYAECGNKNRYLRVDEIIDGTATCTAGWRGRGGQIIWSKRHPVLPLSVLTSYRLEKDA